MKKVKRHFCCDHKFEMHDEHGCKSKLCPCGQPFGKLITGRPPVKKEFKWMERIVNGKEKAGEQK